MPAPMPLTVCDPPRLDWTRPEAPAATDFGDIYFSVDGGLAETEAVYLSGCGLPERWQTRRDFVIGELGFGSGLNVMAVWRMWETCKPTNGRLHIISVEKYPFSAEQLARALSGWPELSEFAARLISIWPGRVKGPHRLHLSKDVTLTVIHDDVVAGFSGLEAKVDAWFLDGFSPAKNPAMWSADVMAQIARLSAPGARVGTFTVAGAVREGLKTAGFQVSKKPGFGRKRQRLEAIYPGISKENCAEPCIKPCPIILGAGIAGASLARSFLRRGITPTLIDPGDNTAASANAAAMVKPRLDLQDRPESRFFLSSYLYALQAYHESGQILSRGVFQTFKTPTERARFEKLAHLAALPQAHMHMADGPFGLKGLNFPEALVIDPIKSCENFSDGSLRVTGRCDSVEAVNGEFIAKDPDGNILATGTHVFAAMGAGIKSFAPLTPLPLRYSRGQISSAHTQASKTLAFGGYAIPMKGYTLLGATHARLTGSDPYAVIAADDRENIDKFEVTSGTKAELIAGGSRASIRVTRANTLPLIESCGPVTALTGLGSRGFVFAPLLGEYIAAQTLGEPCLKLGKIKGAAKPLSS